MSINASPATRTHPPDRRTPVQVAAGQCPATQSCGCCPGLDGRGHPLVRNPKTGRMTRPHCHLPHPGQDRQCRLPYPADIHPCPERKTLPQGGGPLAGCFECGRVTARVYRGREIPWLDVDVPWCGGEVNPS